MRFQSPELYEELRHLHRSQATGYLSVSNIVGSKQHYGILKVFEGEIIHAEYGSKAGLDALTEIVALQNPVLSFGNGAVFEAPDRALPATSQVLNEVATTKSKLTGNRLTGNSRTGNRLTGNRLSGSTNSAIKNLLSVARSEDKDGAGGGLNIFTQVLLAMLIVSLVPVAGQWYINSARVRQDLANSTQETLLSTANALNNQIDAWLNLNLASLDAQTDLPEIRAMEDAALQAPILARLNNASQQTYMAFTITRDGTSVGNTQKSYQDRAFFQAILAGEPVGAQVFYGQVGASLVDSPKQLTLARPVVGFSGELAGALASSIDLATVTDYVTQTTFGETGYAVLVDTNGVIIAHGRPEQLTGGSLTSLSEAVSSPATLTNFVDNGVRSVALKQETQLGWTIFAVQDYRDAFSTLLTAQRFAWILLIVTVVLALLLAYLLARRVVAPIERLTRATDAISLGELETDVAGKTRRDEIGALARAIERLRLTVKIAFQKMQK